MFINYSSTSSEELNTQFSLSTIFLPTHNKEKEDGYIDIDGKMVHYDQQNNIFQQKTLKKQQKSSKNY